MTSVSVAVVTHNRRDEVRALLADLASLAGAPGDEILVVDNGSTDGTEEAVRRDFPAVKLLSLGSNRGAPAARNAAAAEAQGEVVVFLDDDVRIEDRGFLSAVRAAFERAPEMAVAAFHILDPKTRRARSFEIPSRHKDREEEPFETSYFIAAGCAVRRSAYAALGGMDETLFYGFEELDFGYRAVGQGRRLFYRPEIRVFHGLSGVGRPSWRRLRYFLRNKIWISVRLLPWRMALSQIVLWNGFFFVEALKVGRPDVYLKTLGETIIGLPERLRARRTDRLSREAIRRLGRLEGRLYR